jgi:glycosyltransferase involved in cell wall biosynthesis
MVNHYAIPPDLPGGTRHYDLGCELIKFGCEVKIVASDINLATREHTRLKKGKKYFVENINGVEFVWVHTSLYKQNDWRRVWNMLGFACGVTRFDAQQKRPDIIIGSSPHPFAALAALRLAKKNNARFFLELRDLWPQALVDMGGAGEGNLGIKMMRFLEGYLYRRAEKIIVLAEGSANYLVGRWGVLSEKIFYLPNGVHMENFNCEEDTGALRSRYGFEKFTLVYTGAHGPANSLDTVLRAAARLDGQKDIEFVLVGDGPAKDNLMKKASEMKLDNVKFFKPVPKADIPGLLKAADVCIITLKDVKAFSYGISPNKLFDYMASKKPVICAVGGAMGELVRRTGAGIVVPPEDDAALAEAAIRLKNASRNVLEGMGQRGQSAVNQDFSRQELAQKLLTLF